MEYPLTVTTTNNQNINKSVEEKTVEDEGGEEEEESADENEVAEEEIEKEDEDLDDEKNLLRFKKTLMNSIKNLLEMYPKLFCKNINTKDFNHLVDDFIKNLLNYEEIESVETKKLTYNPTPIVELKKQEKRIKTQLPYIPECVKVHHSIVSDTLDIDSDLKYLEDLIQNDSLFAASNETCEPSREIVEPSKIEQDDSKSKTKDKHVGSQEKSSSKEKHKSSDLNSSCKDRSSSKEKLISLKDEKTSSKDKHRSSSSAHKRTTSSSKNSSGSSSTSKRSKHKRSRSKSNHSHKESKRSKHSSSSQKKSQSSTIVISSESSDDDSYDMYSNMDDEKDNGENLVANDNSSPKDEESEKMDDYDEPEYIRKKKKQRIAHVDIFGVPSNPAPVSNRAKVLNPNDRFKQIQEKYKGLNRNKQTTPNAPSSVKISHVPNVPSMLTAKKTISSPSINKNSLLMNDILKRTELKKTIAQTSKKSNRVAHVPSTGASTTKPMIQVDAKGTRIPLVIRQTCLDRIFALYSKYVPPDLASDRAVQVEMETYDKCHVAKSYQNSIANSILRIRKEQSGFFMGSKPELR